MIDHIFSKIFKTILKPLSHVIKIQQLFERKIKICKKGTCSTFYSIITLFIDS